MKKIIELFRKWKLENPDEDYQYDQIYDFVDGELNRADVLGVFEWLESHEYLVLGNK